MSIFNLIEKSKKVSKAVSYSDLAKKIGISKNALSKIRGGGTASEKTILKIAELAKVDPIEAISNYKIQRAKSTAEVEFWRSLLRKAAGVILVGGGLIFLPVGESEASKLESDNFTAYTLCAIVLIIVNMVFVFASRVGRAACAASASPRYA